MKLGDIGTYCSTESWITEKICGQTCAKHGFITNPACHTGKHSNVNLKETYNFITRFL